MAKEATKTAVKEEAKTETDLTPEQLAAKKAEEKAAKEAERAKAREDAKEAAAAAKLQAEKDEIARLQNAKPVNIEEVETSSMSVAVYQPNQVAEFGNKWMASLVRQAVVEEEAQAALNAAAEAKTFLSFEMTRAIFDLADKYADEKKNPIDVYAVFGESKDVEKLNTSVLIRMGIMKKEIQDDDTVKLEWTDPDIERLYSYTKELKDKDEGEYNKRFNNRKRLNMRLNEAYRAVAILRDAGLKPDDLYYSEDKDGNMVPTIRNAPKAIAGDVGVVQMNVRTPVKGATLSPTMSSLVKLANDKHKAPKADRNDKGEQRQGDAKLGMTDEVFGRLINTVRQAITAQEGEFSEDMQKHIVGLGDLIADTIKSFSKKAKA